ncbi:MAG: ribosome maturation factor RimM [Acaryochloridaceae cyanobacterium CSU_3_4]|nr:ribosome maturation factor RimM [Acaryochloridaceae cyanobacterium CSU_3_4]
MSKPFSSSPQLEDASNFAELEDEWLDIGQIVGTQGLNGEVKIYPDSDFPERFEQPGRRWLRFPYPASLQEIHLVKGRFVSRKGIYIVSFAGIHSREQAKALIGASLFVRSCDRPTLATGEYYLSDLIGLTAIDHNTQTKIGTVVGIANAGNNLLEIQPLQGTAPTILIPFVSALVPVVDLDNQIVEICPPKGLIPED